MKYRYSIDFYRYSWWAKIFAAPLFVPFLACIVVAWLVVVVAVIPLLLVAWADGGRAIVSERE